MSLLKIIWEHVSFHLKIELVKKKKKKNESNEQINDWTNCKSWSLHRHD